MALTRPSVLAAFPPFATTFEDRVHCLYTDRLSYVTTGIGNLMEVIKTGQPAPVVYTLPWTHGVGGARASSAEIDAAWWKVKQAWPGTQSRSSCTLTDLRIDDAAIDALVQGTMAANAQYATASRWQRFPDFPADAQMALHSMFWSSGAGFQAAPSFDAAVSRGDWRAASAASALPGVVASRNAANAALLLTAAEVVERGADPSRVWYPGHPPVRSLARSRAIEVAMMLGGAAALVLVGLVAWDAYARR